MTFNIVRGAELIAGWKAGRDMGEVTLCSVDGCEGRLCLDYCHVTGEVGGCLCARCKGVYRASVALKWLDQWVMHRRSVGAALSASAPVETEASR